MTAKNNFIRVIKTPADNLELAVKNFQNHNKASGISPNSIFTPKRYFGILI